MDSIQYPWTPEKNKIKNKQLGVGIFSLQAM